MTIQQNSVWHATRHSLRSVSGVGIDRRSAQARLGRLSCVCAILSTLRLLRAGYPLRPWLREPTGINKADHQSLPIQKGIALYRGIPSNIDYEQRGMVKQRQPTARNTGINPKANVIP